MEEIRKIYNFPVGDDEALAEAALLIYVAWKNRGNIQIGTEIWKQVEGMITVKATRAKTKSQFMTGFQRYLKCGPLRPSSILPLTDIGGRAAFIDPFTGEVLMPEHIEQLKSKAWSFWANLLQADNQRDVIQKLRHEATLIVTVVRARLEEEKAKRLEVKISEEDDSFENS